MKHKIYKMRVAIIVFAILSCLVNQSCTEDFDFNVKNNDPILVIDGVISDQEGPYTIRLMYTANYFSNDTCPAATGAVVTVDDGNGPVIFEEDTNHLGYYRSPVGYRGVVGRTYHLQIDNVDINKDGVMESCEAESTIHNVAPVDSVTMDYYDMHTGFWRLYLNAQDPVEQSDNYVFKVYKNDSLISDRIQKWSLTDDEYFNGNYAIADIYWIDEEDEDGERPKDAPNVEDIYTLEMIGVTDDYYDFLLAVTYEMYPKAPIFSGPAANVPTNISNGALGYFAAYSVASNKLTITQDILDQKK